MQKAPHIPFALEIHSRQPERLMRFYRDLLNLQFVVTAYPYRRYLATLGQFALVIADCDGQDKTTDSNPGTMLILLSTTPAPAGAESYFLFPQRPLGGYFPSRYAERLRDPDGNHVALAAPLEYVQARVPPVASWGELTIAARHLVSANWNNSKMWIRRYRDIVRDRYEYATNHINIIDRNLGGYTHLLTSRQGLFAVSATSYKLLARGRFFGLTIKDGDIYCFQSCGDDNFGRPLRDVRGIPKGRLLRFRIKANQIAAVTVVLRGLDDNVHQIDFVGEDLLVVDCYNACIIKARPDFTCETYYPLGKMSRENASTYHMNSVSGHPDGTIWVLLHNSNKKASEILVLNSNFEITRRFETSAGSAHNIVFTNDESEYLVADTYGGRILSATGPVIENLQLLPRGISLDDTTCVFGESLFETRLFRRYVPGRIHFVDRQSWQIFTSLEVPAAPTDIRRIDGKDLSLSNYVRMDKAKKCEAEIVA